MVGWWGVREIANAQVSSGLELAPPGGCTRSTPRLHTDLASEAGTSRHEPVAPIPTTGALVKFSSAGLASTRNLTAGPGVTSAATRALGRDQELEVRRVGWDDKAADLRRAWRVEVTHGFLGRSRRLTKSFENANTSASGWLQVVCIATASRHLSRREPAGALRLAALTAVANRRAQRGR
jgi:hypothetical protein